MKNNLRQIRRSADITQQQLAEAVGTTRQTIHAIERNKIKTSPSYELMVAIAKYFNKEVDEIFFVNDVRQELQNRKPCRQKDGKVVKEAI